MRALTFTPNAQLVAALQQKHGAPGEVFHAILITQEPVSQDKCKTMVRALSEREYLTLMHALNERSGGKIGQPDVGLFFIGAKANSVGRGSGRVIAKQMTAPGKGFDRMVVEQTMRPLGSSPPQAQQPAPQRQAPPAQHEHYDEDEDDFDEDDEMFDAWANEFGVPPAEAFAQAADQAVAQYDAEARGMPNPQAYAHAASQGAAQYSGQPPPQATAQTHAPRAGAPGMENLDAQQRLLMAQRVALQSSNESMVGGAPPGMGPPGAPAPSDPFHPANRATMAHRIGMESTYATMPNGRQMARIMGHDQAPPGAPPQRRPQRRAPQGGGFDPDAIADSIVDDMFG
jgi:hypothetical protein